MQSVNLLDLVLLIIGFSKFFARVWVQTSNVRWLLRGLVLARVYEFWRI